MDRTVVTTPLTGIDSVLLDLDGVVYLGDHPVAHASDSIAMLEPLGIATAFVTNNAARTPDRVAEHLRSLGIRASDTDVVTSAQAGARLVRQVLGEGPHPVLAVGGPGVAAAIRERGMEPVGRAGDSPRAVLQGFGFDLTWDILAEASLALVADIPWVATNEDISIPLRGGRAPGNGAFIQAVSLATGRRPDLVAGKPHRPLIDESLERLGTERALLVGDRLDTDVEAGANAGIATLLVMTGVTDVVDALLAAPGQRPDLISLDLRGLHHDYPPVIGEGHHWRCGPVTVTSGASVGDLQVTVTDSSVGISNTDDADHPTIDDPVIWSAVMRCLAAAVWQWRDTQGKPENAHTADRGVDSAEDLRSNIAGVFAVAALQGSVDRLRRVAEE